MRSSTGTSAVLRKCWHERKDRHRCAITSMALAPRSRAVAAPRRGRLRGGRPCGTTALRCAVRGRTAELAARPAAALLGHAAVSQKGGRAGARRARGLVLLATASYAGPGGAQPPLAVTTSTGQTNIPPPLRSHDPWMRRSPACHATEFAARSGCPAPVSAPSGGAVRSAGGGAARLRASFSDSRPLSERSVPAGRGASWPCAPAPSSATQSARRADRTPGAEPVQGARIPRDIHLAHPSGAHGRHAPMCETLTLQTASNTTPGWARCGVICRARLQSLEIWIRGWERRMQC